MKKIMVLILCASMVLIMVACGSSSNTDSGASSNAKPRETETPSNQSNSNTSKGETITLGEFTIVLPGSWHIDSSYDGYYAIELDNCVEGIALIGIIEVEGVSIQNNDDVSGIIREFVIEEGLEIHNEFYLESSIESYGYVGKYKENPDLLMAVAVADAYNGMLVIETIADEKSSDICFGELDELLNSISVNQAFIEKAKQEEIANIDTKYTLCAGYYTAGIDVPVGKMNIAVLSGTGNVSSSNLFDTGGINEVMGAVESQYYIQTFKGVRMDEGVVLDISGDLIIEIEYTSISAGFSGREYLEEDAIILTPGNYDAGTDFPAGIYIIEAISGHGNISSSNLFEDGVNEIFGIDNGAGLYTEKVMNVNLPVGVTLEVSGINEIKLIPAK